MFSKFWGDLKTNVLFLQMDELSGTNGKSKIVDHMKRLVTADTINPKKKFSRTQWYLNLLNVVATSNQIMPAMACGASERRFIQVQAAPKRLDLLNKEYFTELFEALENPDVICHFYDTLMARDL